MNEKEIITSLQSIMFQSKLNNKKFFTFAGLFKLLNIKIEERRKMYSYFQEAMKELHSISYNNKFLYQESRNENNELTDVYMSTEALMFTLAKYSMAIRKSEPQKSKLMHQMAFVLRKYQKRAYCESRLEQRQKYKEITKNLRSFIKQEANRNYSSPLQYRLSNMYGAILLGYYGEKNPERLNLKKSNKSTLSYLDHISAKELSDLVEIQKLLLEKLHKNPNADFKDWAYEYARGKKLEFCKIYSKIPYEYPSHDLKPERMCKEFYKMCEKYGLTESESAVREIENLK